ncbi:hypothetical protein H0W26_04020 [Candidatus Dependentiae bacterium]|nr:hypothetical protein [Candidatus Dependentiae bacterium]
MTTPDTPKPIDVEALLAIAARFATQDNRCTAHAAFHVQRRTRTVGLDPNLLDDPDAILFVEQGEMVPSDHWKPLEQAFQNDTPSITVDETEYTLSELDRYGFMLAWETVQVCFTEQGALDYLRADGHNISRDGEPRIFVESFHRNAEMIEFRDLIPFLPDLLASHKRLAEVEAQLAELTAAVLAFREADLAIDAKDSTLRIKDRLVLTTEKLDDLSALADRLRALGEG